MTLGNVIDDSELPAQNILKGVDLKGSVQVPIVGVGSHQFPRPDGSSDEQRTITIKIDGQEKSCVVGGDNLPGMVTGFGKDVTKWVGQQVVISPKEKLNPQTKQKTIGLLIVPAPRMG
jgi:hypothetical protein